MAVVVVTGASTGIGRAIAERLGREGNSVLLNSLRDVEGGEAVAARILAAGGSAAYVAADVSTTEGVAAVFDAAERSFGPPTSLVNNAGATRSTEIGQWTAENWHDMLNTNLITTALMSQEFLGRLPAGETGAIVNIASIRGIERYGRVGAAAYSAAKAGVINLTAALAAALAPGITVNAVSPGFVETDYMTRADPALRQSWLDGMPSGRFIDPDEVAQLVAFLLGQPSINGANVVVDGGWTVARG
jgi:3-oxoacyl-[acyl-carrier protein] reductase